MPQQVSTVAAKAVLAFVFSGRAIPDSTTTPKLTAATNAEARRNVHAFSCSLPTPPPSIPPKIARMAPNDTDATAIATAYIVLPCAVFPSSVSVLPPPSAVQNSMSSHAAAPATTGNTAPTRRRCKIVSRRS